MQEPQVTAIIPVFNHEKWVQESILSIVNNTYPKKRLVVVDDGSTDNSFEMVLKLLKNANRVNIPKGREPRISYRGTIEGMPTIASSFRKSYGPSFARNYGIKTGWEGTDLFAFLDSDDTYFSEKISKSVAKWLEFPNQIGVIYSDYFTVGNDGIEHRQFKEPFSRTRLLQECIINNDSLYAKWVLEKIGGYDDSLKTVEDMDLHLRATEISMAIHIPEALVKIKVGIHSSTNKVSKENWEANYRKVFEKLNQRLNGKI